MVNVNMNGLYNDPTPDQAIIKYHDASSAITTPDASNVIPEIGFVYDANNVIYNRRRLRFVKLEFIPAYTNVQMSTIDSGDADVPLAPAPRIFIISEKDGIDVVDQTSAITVDQIPQLLANPQAKMLKYPRKIKMMMRGVKYPYSPKYQSYDFNSDDNYGQWNKAGMWINARRNSPLETQPHMALIATGVPASLAGQYAYYVKHTFYFEWFDRVYNNTQ